MYLSFKLRQGFVLQAVDCVEGPVQFDPPWAAEGSVQVRFLILEPPPHVWLQAS